MSSLLSQPGAPCPHSPTCPLHLLAVFVVVHAGQCLVRVAIDVRVRATHIPIPGPAHVTLGRHPGWELVLWVGSPHPTFFRLYSYQPVSGPSPPPFPMQAPMPVPRRGPEPDPFPQIPCFS